jgi:hypothetical protein
MIQVSGLAFGYNRDIQERPELLTVSPEQLTNPTFKLIAANSITNFATYSYSQP